MYMRKMYTFVGIAGSVHANNTSDAKRGVGENGIARDIELLTRRKAHYSIHDKHTFRLFRSS